MSETIIGQDNTKLLEGRQLVVEGTMQAGDLLVFPAGETQVLLENDWRINWDLQKYYERGGTIRVYRKMDVAHHLGYLDDPCPPVVGNAHTPLTQEQLPFARAKTYDDGKPPLAWLPWKALDEVALVQLYGHAKYKDFNNYRKGMEVSRNLSCALRHIRAYMNGETNDPESKRPHLAHATCRLLFVLENIADGTAIDDRYSKQPTT